MDRPVFRPRTGWDTEASAVALALLGALGCCPYTEYNTAKLNSVRDVPYN